MSDDPKIEMTTGTSDTVKTKVSQVNWGPGNKPWHDLTDLEKSNGEWKQYFWCDILMGRKLSKSDIRRNEYMKRVEEKQLKSEQTK